MFTPYATNCVLCLPPTSAFGMHTPSVGNIYSYMSQVTCIQIFVLHLKKKKKKDHYDTGSGTCICQNKHPAYITIH